MRILFFILFFIIILNNTKVYEGLDQTCDIYKDDDFEDTTSDIKKFKEYIIKSVKTIIKHKSDCNKCMHCIIEQTSEQLKEQENKKP